jgi:hypothetical protein
LLLAGTGLARAQTGGSTTGSSSLAGSSLSGGSSTGGGSMGGGSSGASSSSGVSNLVGSGSFIGSGQMMVNPGLAASTANSMFRSGTNNPFASYYVHPLTFALGTNVLGSNAVSGLTAGTGAATTTRNNGGFGLPIFANLANTANNVTATVHSGRGMGLATGLTRVPAYATVIDFDYRRPPPAEVQDRLQAMLALSPSLPGAAIRVRMDGGTVVLEGAVGTERQRRLAENMVRLTPGVRDVRNQLAVEQVARAPQP